MMAPQRLWLAAGLLLVPVLGAAKDLEIASVWAPAPVKVDGTAAKWSALVKPLADVPMLIGVQNDKDNLYLCFKASDQWTRMQLGRSGLTVWANGAGKMEKGFGVRFPLAGGSQRMQRERGPQVPGPRGEARAQTPGQVPREFELIGPTENDRLRVQPAADQPVAAALGDDSGVTIVELRIPLKPTESHPLAVGAAPGATIALGLAADWLGRSDRQGVQGGGTTAGQPASGAPGAGQGTQGGAAPAGQPASGAPAGGQATQGGATPAGQPPAGALGTPPRGYAHGPSSRGHRGATGGGGQRGGHDTVSAVNLWLHVSLATPPARKKGAPATPAEAPVPPAETPVAPANPPAPPTTR